MLSTTKSILEQIDKERYKIRNCEKAMYDCERAGKCKNALFHADYMDIKKDRVDPIAIMLDGDLKTQVLKTIYDYCYEEKQVHEVELRNLIQQLTIQEK